MAELIDLKDKIRRYYKFTPYEARGLIIAILAVGFIISFKDWGFERFSFSVGLLNLFNAILVAALSILVHDAGQRLWGLAIGYRIEFRMWTLGLVGALAVAFISNGSIWVIVPGGFMLHHLAGHRLGWFRYGVNYFGQGIVALAGCLFTLMLIIFLKILGAFFPNNLLIGKAVMFNIIYLITSLLPIPPLDGSKIFFGSRMLYAFAIPALIVAAVLMIVEVHVFLALVLSMLVGVVLWLVYYISFERKVWKGP
ncbi:hypothetical protein HY637_03855 [Candidatus Woesearchaeota archaeon]|nr:hypothetical protein [Candidatus Woesearchaeota archaeon]